MCISSTKQAPVITRPDPNIKYVDGNIMNPKDNPPEIDKTQVKKPEKKVVYRNHQILRQVKHLI